MGVPLLFPEHSIVTDPPPPPLDAYVVLAYWQPGGWWRMWPDLWETEAVARDHAQELPRGWIHKRILRIRVGP